MGRLQDIVDRNRHANRRSRERVLTSMFFGCAILVIIFLMVFTDLGKPPVPRRAPTSVAPADKRIDGVLLRKATARPSPAPSPAPASGSSH